MIKDEENIKRMTAKEFRETGCLLIINQILHVFGLAIVCDIENNSLYPARTKYRGFDEKSVTEGYKKVTNYLCENIIDLVEEVDDDTIKCNLCETCERHKKPKVWQNELQACKSSYKDVKVERGTGNIYECKHYVEVGNDDDF